MSKYNTNKRTEIEGYKGWSYKFGPDNYSLYLLHNNGIVISSHKEKYVEGKYYYAVFGIKSAKIYKSHKEAIEAGIKFYTSKHIMIGEQLEQVFKGMNSALEK